ncbi:MAG: glycosyltransferase [Anaerolineae bacterium]|nr:glycosyltransferase [Anaerolineae bacterium]
MLSGSRTVALLANDVIGIEMAGPGIRYWELAQVLGHHFQTKLIIPPFIPPIPHQVVLNGVFHCQNVQELRSLLEDCDVIVTLGVVLAYYPFLARLKKPLVLDIYDPFLLAGLQRDATLELLQQIDANEKSLSALQMQLRAGDFFICAGEKQRDYWLGMLSALGRINPYTYQDDPTLRRLIDVVPFGLPATPPIHTRQVLKGVYKTIAPTDKVILWGGGIWNWFDAQTLVRAMAIVRQQRNDVKVFFMGTKRPNHDAAKMEAVEETIALSRTLGLYDVCVFFNDWIPYDERQNYLLEADIGISLHRDSVETRFAFRTRLLDYMWAALPVVATEGDVLGEGLATRGVAYLVAPGDVEGVAALLLKLLDASNLRAIHAERFVQVAADYHWERVAQPLVDFCSSPYVASDKTYLSTVSTPSEWQRLLGRTWRTLRTDGVWALLKQVQDYLRWKRHS